MRERNWKAERQKPVQILSFCLDLAFTVAIYGGSETTEVIKSCTTVRRRIKTLITGGISKKPRNTMFHMARPGFTVSGGFGRVRNERSGIRIIYVWKSEIMSTAAIQEKWLTDVWIKQGRQCASFKKSYIYFVSELCITVGCNQYKDYSNFSSPKCSLVA